MAPLPEQGDSPTGGVHETSDAARLAAHEAFIRRTARRKNGLNMQIAVAGALVCLSSIPLILAFTAPVLSWEAFAFFLLGSAMAAAGWPVFRIGCEAKERLAADLARRGVPYTEVDREARRLTRSLLPAGPR